MSSRLCSSFYAHTRQSTKPWRGCTAPGLATVALKPRSEVQAWLWSCDLGQGCQQSPGALPALMGEAGVMQQNHGPTGCLWSWKALGVVLDPSRTCGQIKSDL